MQLLILTIDDGPYSYSCTNGILNILHKQGVQAVFFLTGECVNNFPDITAQISSSRHLIGNHAYSHVSLRNKSEEEIRQEIRRTKEVNPYLSVPKLFRPPYGTYTLKVKSIVESMGYEFWLWDTVIENFTGQGSIILAHQTKWLLDNLDNFIENVRRQGFNFKTIHPLLL
jgi:peptidoglycan-N-acetylglucosamine deacetylase